MADLRPFRAYRPRKGMEDKIAALPYDVYSREEAVKAVTDNPLSFLCIDRAETQFGPEVDTYAPQVYDKARELLWKMVEEGLYVQDEIPCYYLYQLTMDGRSQTGIVACASIDDYQNNIIKKHENTRADKEEDRIRHVDICDAQTGPIFLAYRSEEALRTIIKETLQEEPLYHFVSDDGIGHKVYKISEPEQVERIRSAFARYEAVYIADGHHRCASAVKVGMKRRGSGKDYNLEAAYNYFMAVLFPDEELKILDYNRVVTDMNGLRKEEFLDKIKKCFDVTFVGFKPCKPSGKGVFGMYLEDTWYELKARDELFGTDVVEGLDVSVLQKYLLDPILGIHDPKTDKRIDFVGGIRGLKELERRVHTDMKVAFALYPTSIRELFAVADADRLMPPKSTWFEPKLRSGLFIHSLKSE